MPPPYLRVPPGGTQSSARQIRLGESLTPACALPCLALPCIALPCFPFHCAGKAAHDRVSSSPPLRRCTAEQCRKGRAGSCAECSIPGSPCPPQRGTRAPSRRPPSLRLQLRRRV